jgi:hypothetical protein
MKKPRLLKLLVGGGRRIGQDRCKRRLVSGDIFHDYREMRDYDRSGLTAGTKSERL